VHGVEDLAAEVALADGAGLEEELVAEGALAVVDVGDDGEVADQLRVGHGGGCGSSSRGVRVPGRVAGSPRGGTARGRRQGPGGGGRVEAGSTQTRVIQAG